MKKLLPLLILIVGMSGAKAQYYGGYGGGYGYGGGNATYNRTVQTRGFSSTTSGSYQVPYGNAVYAGATLNGTANIIGAAAPILMQLISVAAQPRVVVQQNCNQGYAPYPYPIRYYDP
jgi:hypothetical protein